MISNRQGFLPLILLAVAVTGCSNMMGGLRRDLNDEPEYAEGPVTGGVWPERGFLAESMGENGFGRDRYAAPDNRGRGPASDDPGAPREGSWVGGAREDQNNRDRVRGADDGGDEVSFNPNPNNPPASKKKYKNGNRATRSDFIDESPNEGSLWASDGQTNYYFTKNKIRGIGDIVNLNIESEVLRDMTLEVKRTLNGTEKAKEVAIAQDKLRAEAMGVAAPAQGNGAATAANGNANANGAGGANGQNRAPAAQSASVLNSNGSEPQVRQATLADIDLKTALEIKEGDQVLSEIVERYPNGNYKIRGTKRIPYKNGAPRLMTITGIVKGTDIGEDDIVKSSKLYEYRLEALR